MQDRRAPTAGALDAAVVDQLAEGPPDGDQAAAVVGGQVAFGRQPLTGRPHAVVEVATQVQVDLVVHRHGAELEAEASHLGAVSSFAAQTDDGPDLVGLARSSIADNVISNRVKPGA